MTPRKKYDDDIDWSKVTQEDLLRVMNKLAEIDARRKTQEKTKNENQTT